MTGLAIGSCLCNITIKNELLQLPSIPGMKLCGSSRPPEAQRFAPEDTAKGTVQIYYIVIRHNNSVFYYYIGIYIAPESN